MTTIKYTMQIHRNYEMFKDAIGKLCNRISLTDEQKDKYYLYAKADLYNIDITDFIDDPVALEQAIDAIEISERKNERNQRSDYYSTRGC